MPDKDLRKLMPGVDIGEVVRKAAREFRETM